MSYIVQIKQLSTGSVHIRREDEAWHSDSLVWIRGNRACDCNRALLFAEQEDRAPAYCGVSAYAIRVIDSYGAELYCEAEFDPSAGQAPSDQLFHDGVAHAQVTVAIGSHRAAMRARIGALAQQILDRLSVPAARPGQDVLAGHHDQQ
jgi:hypothetical protein